jgi:hypothetical protein
VSKAPVETAQPSNQSSEPSFSHDIHCPVRVEFVRTPSTINATPTPHSQNAGGRHNTSTIATAATKNSHVRTREFRNVKALSMTSNVPVQRPGTDNWMLALYSSPVRCNRLLDVAPTRTSQAPFDPKIATISKPHRQPHEERNNQEDEEYQRARAGPSDTGRAQVGLITPSR